MINHLDVIAGPPATDVPPVSPAYNLIAWAGAAIVLLLLGRAVHDRALRYLAATLVLFAASRFLATIPPHPAVLHLIVNLVVIASACGEVCFFRTVMHADTSPTRPVRVGKEIGAAAMVAIIGTTAWLLVPEAARSGALATTDYAHDPAAFVFVTVIIGYYIVVSVRVINWTRQLIPTWVGQRSEAPLQDGSLDARRFKVARRVFQIGVVIIGLAELLRFIADVVKFGNELTALLSPASLAATKALSPAIEAGIRTGHTAFYIGALLPLLAGAVAGIPILIAHTRQYRVLGPLWREIIRAFPGLAFRSGRGISSRLYRREIEIRDGLVLLGPYYDRDLATRAGHAGAGDTDREIAVTVALIRGALRAHRAAQPVADPHPLPVSGADTRAADLTWIIQVAAAFTDAEKAHEPLTTAEA